MSHYEAFSLGVASMIADIPDEPSPDLLGKLKEALQAAKEDQTLKTITTGGGKNFRRLYEQKIKIVADSIRAAL
jgi:hypothetical protein